MTYISWSSDFYLLFFALKNILVLFAKPDSGELRCPATALISHGLASSFWVEFVYSLQACLLVQFYSVDLYRGKACDKQTIFTFHLTHNLI